ncbi:MAG: DUF4398 domain-containing protein [Gammaproteobacteria bacterium]|nr:DUF4398 domain-containing protein [Gammaproteobacteria bacterium]
MRLHQTSHLLKAAWLGVLFGLAACQTAPVQEMSDARQAISVAREAGAAEHAADVLQAAVDYLQSAERHLTDRQYENAREDALQAKLKALDALRLSESSSETDP